MARHQEPLDRGLVTIRDPALLKPGELSFIRNAVYLPGSNALQRARGRAAFGTATASAVDVAGLRDLKFDNGNHYLIAHTSASYLSAVVGDTGTFGSLVSGIGVGTSLEVVQYRNRYFLFNGTSTAASALGSNKVAYLSATATANVPTTRQHGMLAVESAPNVATAAGTFALTVTGYYEYWSTEVAKVTQDGAPVTLESAFSSDSGPTTVLVSATGVVPRVSLPTVRNSITTHWRIYRSPKKTLADDKVFPSGFMIADLATGTSAHSDSSVTASASGLPTIFNSSPTEIYSGFASASSMATDNGVYASATVGSSLVLEAQGCYGFSVPAFNGVIRGITVEVQGYVSAGSAPVPVNVAIGPRADGGDFFYRRIGILPPIPIKASKSGLITGTTAGAPTTLTLGGATDRWFPSDLPGLSDADFVSSLMVVLSISKPSTSVGFDYVKITVHYGASIETTVPFPAVVYTFGDITSSVAKNHPPPSSSTGALFQDSLVVNDVDQPSMIRWSFPGDPEAFPPSYFLDFETRENDRVRYIGTVNNRLIVGLDSSLWRVNYLPSERDATFDRGNAIEPITRNYGIVNPMCACVFSTDGLQERLAFVSNQGIHSTDGFNLDTYSKDLDWRGDRDGLGIAPTDPALSADYTPIALINDRERQELLFYFRNDAVGFGGSWFCLHFQYNELIDNKPRISGFVTMENNISGGRAAPKSAWPVVRASGNTDVYIGYGVATGVNASSSAAGAGQVYRETGTTIPSTNPSMRYMTRRMYLSGMGNEWRLGEVYGYAGLVSWGGGNPGTIQYQALNRKTNSDVAESGPSKTHSFAGTEVLHRVTFSQMVEGLRINAIVSGEGTFAQEMLILDGEGFGPEDSGL